MAYIFGLQYLDSSEVADSLVFDLISIKPNDQRGTQYSDYLVESYISENFFHLNYGLIAPSAWLVPPIRVNHFIRNLMKF